MLEYSNLGLRIGLKLFESVQNRLPAETTFNPNLSRIESLNHADTKL